NLSIMKLPIIVLLCVLSGLVTKSQVKSQSPVIPEADGFIIIKGAQMQPEKSRVYKAVYDASKQLKDSSQILPALNMAGSELNALGVCGIPVSHAKFVIVFHGAAINGILDNPHYKAKYGIDNPNLKVLAELRKNGVRLFVCGQNLLAEQIDPETLSKDVSVASDALIVLMTFQNQGYALLSF
ncbi:MAG TPA: DsrE family protein, partial [Chitinophagaceae bacterium]